MHEFEAKLWGKRYETPHTIANIRAEYECSISQLLNVVGEGAHGPEAPEPTAAAIRDTKSPSTPGGNKVSFSTWCKRIGAGMVCAGLVLLVTTVLWRAV